jgi:uncharacterized protein
MVLVDSVEMVLAALMTSGRTLVIVPGHGDSGAGHWQTWLEQSSPKVVRVRQTNWERPLRWRWTAGLERAMLAVESPGSAILIAHSLGVLTVAAWATRSRQRAKVAGALLVAPPDVTRRLPRMPSTLLVRLAGWLPIPMARLPFPSIVVGSANDPMCPLARARDFAQAWGAEFIDAGPAGHINTLAGFGPWPGVHALIERLGA